MKNYIYDGSFEGLLTLIYELYYSHQIPNKIISDSFVQENLLDANIFISTDDDKASKVYNAIKNKISPDALQTVFYAYLSECENSGIEIYNYVKLGFKIGKDIDLHISDERVLKIHNIRKKVVREIHLLLGLLRFKCIKGDIYYSQIEPDNNIAALIAPHFAKRMPAQNWIIHDIKRGIAAFYNKKEWCVTNIGINQNPCVNEDELFYQGLWREYFKSTAIINRLNPILQAKNMPKRYWKHLIEKTF